MKQIILSLVFAIAFLAVASTIGGPLTAVAGVLPAIIVSAVLAALPTSLVSAATA